MSTPALIDALITARKLDKLREALDAHPHLLRAWKSASWMTRAAHTGRIDLLEELHRRGLGVDDTGSDGLPPLWAAVAHPEVVAWLLDRGADARHPAVLVSAASRGDLDTVRRLVAAGGDRHATFGDPPRTAYEQAVRMGRPAEIVDALRPPGPGFDVAAWLAARLGPGVAYDRPVRFGGARVDLALHAVEGAVVCVTHGLSAHALPGLPYRAEVSIRLPVGYPRTAELGARPEWPAEWLASVVEASASRPVLRPLDTVGNGEPPRPLAPDAPFVGALVLDEEHDGSLPDGTAVKLLSLLPLWPDELALARRDPMALVRAFAEAGVEDDPVVCNRRRSVLAGGASR